MHIVPLKKPTGHFAVVDDQDASWAAGLRLSARTRARRWTPGDSIVSIHHGRQKLHRTVMEQEHGPLPASTVVVPRNGIGFDCRRSNLRTMTLAQASRLHRDATRGVRRYHDMDDKGRLLDTVHFAVLHGHQRLGHYRTYDEAISVKLAAEARDGYLAVEDQEALKQELIELLETCVVDGRLRRHIVDAPQIENRYRVA